PRVLRRLGEIVSKLRAGSTPERVQMHLDALCLHETGHQAQHRDTDLPSCRGEPAHQAIHRFMRDLSEGVRQGIVLTLKGRLDDGLRDGNDHTGALPLHDARGAVRRQPERIRPSADPLLPEPDRLLPERPVPGWIQVPLIAAPHRDGQHIQPAPIAVDPLQRGGDARRLPIVDLQWNATSPTSRHLLRRVLDGTWRAVTGYGPTAPCASGHVDRGARVTERERDATATAATGARDDGDLARERPSCLSHPHGYAARDAVRGIRRALVAKVGTWQRDQQRTTSKILDRERFPSTLTV